MKAKKTKAWRAAEHKLQKRSQITIFIIAGIVMMMTTGLVFYAAVKMKTRQQAYLADSSPLTKYVNGCVEKFTSEATELASQQGGYIYISQGGKHVADYIAAQQGALYIKHNGHDVPYLISQPIYQSPYYSEYPWRNFPWDNDFVQKSYIFSGIGITDIHTYRASTNTLPIEQNIKDYIETQLDREIGLLNTPGQKPRCLSFEENFKDYKVDIKPGIQADVALRDNEVFVKATIKLTVTQLTTNTKFTLTQFSASKPSKLKQLYMAASDIIRSENTDFNFMLKNAQAYQGKKLTVTDYGTKGDIIELSEDTGSRFLFARQNRKPALEYIRETALNLGGGGRCGYDEKANPAKVTCRFTYWDVYECCQRDDDNRCTRCCFERQQVNPPSYTVTTSQFTHQPNQPVAVDPDEDTTTIYYGMNQDAEKASGEIMTVTGPLSTTSQIYIIASDGQLKDWQTITYDIAWQKQPDQRNCD
ncbi:hypothetical protein HY640_02475 [Candidatus Woesearchaeota archaeon]|nr:hypothetical protein [Candidatus Woesearchaeota archaeon]